VRRLGHDPLSLGDDPLLDLPGIGPRLLPGGPGLFAPMIDLLAEHLQARLQSVQVAHRPGVLHADLQPLDGRLRLGGGQVGGRDPLFDEGDLGFQRRELALEEG
jgi:hypothetical protein